MKKGLTELVFILDKSGSMGGLEKDTSIIRTAVVAQITTNPFHICKHHLLHRLFSVTALKSLSFFHMVFAAFRPARRGREVPRYALHIAAYKKITRPHMRTGDSIPYCKIFA